MLETVFSKTRWNSFKRVTFFSNGPETYMLFVSAPDTGTVVPFIVQNPRVGFGFAENSILIHSSCPTFKPKRFSTLFSICGGSEIYWYFSVVIRVLKY